MKKIITAVMTVCLTMAMTVTAFAAPSVSTEKVVGKVTEVKDANGNAVEVTVKALPAAQQALVNEIKNVETLKQLLGATFTENTSVVGVQDVTVPAGTAFPVTLTFEVSGVKADSTVSILHYDEAAAAWEVIPATAGSKTVTGTFNSLSPVAFAVDSTTTDSTVAPTDEKSPKTGEVSGTMVATVLAVAALAGMGITYKKRKLTK